MQVSKIIYKKNNKLIFEEVEGKIHFLDERNDSIITLNKTAAFIWKNLDKKSDKGKLVKLLTEKYKVTEVKAKKDLGEVLSRFEKLGLVVK